MIEYVAARILVVDFINKNKWGIEDEIVVMDELTIYKDYGWVFFYESRRFLETDDYHDKLYGNAPLIVEKEDGSFHYTGTARDTEYYIKQYEKQRKWKTFWSKFSLFKRSQT
jgi:hypothetical protein